MISMHKQNRISIPFLLFAILILGTLLRIYHLETESMTLDEVYSIRLSENSILGIINGLKTDAHPPLYFITLHYWMQLLGNEPLAVRSLSLLFGIISIGIVYRIANLISGPLTGIWSSIIFALSPFYIQYSQQTRGYTLLLLLVLMSFYFFLKMLFVSENSNKNAIGYIIFTSAMLYTHNYAIFIFLSQIIYVIILYMKGQEPWKKWLIPISAVNMAYLLWLPIVYLQAFKVRENWNPKLNITWDDAIGTMVTWSGSWQLLILLLLFVVYGSWNIKASPIKEKLLLGVWCVVSIIPPMLISLVKPMYMDRYSVGSAAAFYILAAQGLSKFRSLRASFIVIIALLVFYAPALTGYYQKSQKENWSGMVQFVQEKENDGDVILVSPAKAVIPVRYYYRGQSVVYPLDPYKFLYKVNLMPYGVTDELDLSEHTEKLLNGLIKSKKRVWLILRSEVFEYHLEQDLTRALENTVPSLEKKFQGGYVYLYNVPR